MAKLVGPLFSLSAHGTLGKVLTYSTRAIVKQVRYQRGQKDYVNDARTAQREIFKGANDWWYLLTPEEQASFAGYDAADE